MNRLALLGWLVCAIAGCAVGLLREEREWRRIRAARLRPLEAPAAPTYRRAAEHRAEGGYTTATAGGW